MNGNAVGAVSRVPMQGEARANLHVGATAQKATINQRDQEICNSIGPILREKGLLFVGIDVIGGYITEINVTSPTGIQEINQFVNQSVSRSGHECVKQSITQFSFSHSVTQSDSVRTLSMRVGGMGLCPLNNYEILNIRAAKIKVTINKSYEI